MRESTTSTYVAQYVEDNQAFINDFAAAFVKMVKVLPSLSCGAPCAQAQNSLSILASKSQKP
jgi:hypothetical protein